jgi:hypothetical protein
VHLFTSEGLFTPLFTRTGPRTAGERIVIGRTPQVIRTTPGHRLCFLSSAQSPAEGRRRLRCDCDRASITAHDHSSRWPVRRQRRPTRTCCTLRTRRQCGKRSCRRQRK